MKKIMTKHSLFLILLSFLNFVLLAQTEQYKADIKTSEISKFKSIALTPKIRAVANDNFSDIRILDEQKHQVPYFLLKKFAKTKVEFIPIKNNISNKKKSTSVVIYNPERKLYNQFSFKVTNANVNKTCKIEGSNHMKKWFVISEKKHLRLHNNHNKAYNYYNINFPSIDYEYIKLTINDTLAAPINVKDVGIFKSSYIKNENPYINLNYSQNITQNQNKTLIHFKSNRDYEINKIDFKIGGNEFYDRTIRFYTKTSSTKKSSLKVIFKTLTLNSKNTNSFYNLSIKEKDFWIEVDNKDNQPLHFKKINLLQKQQYLVASIKANKNYYIIAGDKKLNKPSYDIEKFKNEIETNLPIINLKNETISSPSISKNKEKVFYEQAWFMWFSIGLVAILIFYFTLSLIKQTKEN